MTKRDRTVCSTPDVQEQGAGRYILFVGEKDPTPYVVDAYRVLGDYLIEFVDAANRVMLVLPIHAPFTLIHRDRVKEETRTEALKRAYQEYEDGLEMLKEVGAGYGTLITVEEIGKTPNTVDDLLKRAKRTWDDEPRVN